MSTSLLYHGFGIRGYKYVRTEYVGKEVVFTIRQERDRLRCPACGGRNVQPRQRVVHIPQSHADHVAGRSVARGRVDFRRLGGIPGSDSVHLPSGVA